MSTKDNHLALLKRKRINVEAVGFALWMQGLAIEFGPSGCILNDQCGITIEIEGSSLSVVGLIRALNQRVSSVARVVSLTLGSLLLQVNLSHNTPWKGNPSIFI